MLDAEIARCRRHEMEKEALLDIVHQQSKQLRQITNACLENQTLQHTRLAAAQQQIDQALHLVQLHLDQAQQLINSGIDPQQVKSVVTDHVQSSLDVLSRVRQQSEAATQDLEEAAAAQQSLRRSPILNLSDREYEIMQLLAQGKSNNEIAEMLFLAKTTVSTYRRRIMDKLRVNDLPGLVRVALQHEVVA